MERQRGRKASQRRPAAVRPQQVGVNFDDLSGSAQLREIALCLFAEYGIQSTSIRMVAAAAGISPGGVLHHFPSKKALESAVFREATRRLFEAVHAVSPSAPPRTAVQERYGAMSALLQQQPYLSKYLRRVFTEGGEGAVEVFKLMLDAMRTGMSARIEAGNAREMEDPDITLALFWLVSSAEYLIAPQLEALGLDLTDPKDIRRLHRAQTELLTNPLFPSTFASDDSGEDRP